MDEIGTLGDVKVDFYGRDNVVRVTASKAKAEQVMYKIEQKLKMVRQATIDLKPLRALLDAHKKPAKRGPALLHREDLTDIENSSHTIIEKANIDTVCTIW